MTRVDTRYFMTLGSVRSFARTATGLILEVGDERCRVDVVRPDVLRLAISKGGVFDERPTYACVPQSASAPPFEVRDEAELLVLETAALRLRVRRDRFALAAHRVDGTVIFEDATDDRGEPRGYLWLNDEFVVTRRAAPHDSIYGLGEKTGRFDRRGRDFVLWNVDVLHSGVVRLNRLEGQVPPAPATSTSFDPYYVSIPFFQHCRERGTDAELSGFFVDNGYAARFEFSHGDALRYHFAGGQYVEYVFAGPKLTDILEAYTELTGRIPVPPLWALGLHQCRYHDYDARGVQRVAAEYRARGLPCDVLWLDIGYMDGYRVFTWNEERFPDPASLLEELRAEGFRAVTIVDPGVKREPGYAVYDEGAARGYFCKTASGTEYVGQVWPGRTVFPDFSRSAVRSWWGERIGRHVALGIAGIWNDMNEPATGDVPPFAMRFGEQAEHPHERFHNGYALLMAMATREGLERAQPELRPFVLSRAGSAGIQRYAALWTGDNQSDWAHLEASVPMLAGLGVSGHPFVGADVTGFAGRASAELAARWIQHGALTPFCRYHNSLGEADHYPWSFGRGVEAASRAAIELRYRLLPYLYSTFVEASRSGLPVLRPLLVHFQGDRQARDTEDAYLVGAALLVAPVLGPGVTARNVYLPEGSWIDWYEGDVYQGARFVAAAAPLDRIPLFVRGGSVIPTYDPVPRTTMGHFPESVTLEVFVPAEDGRFVSELHEDDGVTTRREQGRHWHTTFVLERSGATLTLRGTVAGSGFDEFRREAFRVVVRGAAPKRASLDGGALPLEGSAVEFPNRAEDFELRLEL